MKAKFLFSTFRECLQLISLINAVCEYKHYGGNTNHETAFYIDRDTADAWDYRRFFSMFRQTEIL
jgi:hypothetical protein